jgi:putative pyruvate formate lyase activating enzyme
MPGSYPAYLILLSSGELQERVRIAYERLSSCTLCAWECKVDRRAGKMGICRTGETARVSSYGAHMGEEDPLRGRGGSGTIFFSRCNLHCQFCQNHDISQTDAGQLTQPEEIAAMMLELQAAGCHNINLVSPSHVVPQIMAALLLAAQAGLHLPLVYNTGGYDSLQTLALLDGVVDIYMPDMKYASPQIARHYSKIPDYPQVNQAGVREMYRQVGDLQIDGSGIAQRGLLVRHLILPNNLAGTQEVVRFLAQEISPDTYLNLMDQYRPAFNARQFPKLNRRISSSEYKAAVTMAAEAGLHRLDNRQSIAGRLP